MDLGSSIGESSAGADGERRRPEDARLQRRLGAFFDGLPAEDTLHAVDDIDMPATPFDVWSAIRAMEGRSNV